MKSGDHSREHVDRQGSATTDAPASGCLFSSSTTTTSTSVWSICTTSRGRVATSLPGVGVVALTPAVSARRRALVRSGIASNPGGANGPTIRQRKSGGITFGMHFVSQSFQRRSVRREVDFANALGDEALRLLLIERRPKSCRPASRPGHQGLDGSGGLVCRDEAIEASPDFHPRDLMRPPLRRRSAAAIAMRR